MVRCCKSRRTAATKGGSNAVSLKISTKEFGGTNVSLEGTTTSQNPCPETYSKATNLTCFARWSSECGENCAKESCTAHGGSWVPKDYTSNSYTCNVSGDTCPDGYSKSTEWVTCTKSWTSSCGQDCSQEKCTAHGGFWVPNNSNPYTCEVKSAGPEHHELYGVYEGNELPAGGSEISSAEACKAAIEKVNEEVSSGMPGYVYEGETSDGSLPKGCVLGEYSSKWDKFYAYYNTADTGSTKGGYTKLFNFAPGYKVTEAAKKHWQAGSNSCPDGTRQINNYDDCQAAASTLHAVHPSSVSGNAVKKRGEWDLPGGCHFDYNAQTVTFNPYAGIPKGGVPLICAESPSLDGGVKIRTPLEMARWAYITRNYVDPHTELTQDIQTLKSF